MKGIAFGRLGISLHDFRNMTHVEILRAEKERMDMWHLQNAVNASFFTTVLQVLGAKTKGGRGIERSHLYRLPDEPESDYIDASTEEGRKKINEMIAKYG